MDGFVDEWITYWSSEEREKAQYDPVTGESIETPRDVILDWTIDEKHELLWKFVVTAYKRDLSDHHFSLLAAGELEDLIADFGEIYIKRIEELSRKDPKFRRLLGGVWRNSSKPEVWDRVERSRGDARR